MPKIDRSRDTPGNFCHAQGIRLCRVCEIANIPVSTIKDIFNDNQPRFKALVYGAIVMRDMELELKKKAQDGTRIYIG